MIRNEQRYATPPGALFVYTALTWTWAASRSYEPQTMWKNPAGNFVGCAVESNAPWSASTSTRSPVILPFFAQISLRMM